MTKATNEEVYKILQSTDEIAKINCEDLVKDALLSLPKKEDELEAIEQKIILNYLESIKEKALKDFLNSIRNKKIQEIKEELGSQMDKYNKGLYTLIVQSKLELKEEKKKNEILIKETKTLNAKITKLESHNKNLNAQIKESQAILLTLQKNYSMLSSQKILFQEIMAAFPGQTPLEIITELKTAKKGSMVLLESFTNMNQEMAEMKKNQEMLDKKYSKKINYLTNENDQLLMEKKDDKEKYNKMLNELKNRMKFNQNKIKESDYLRNTLYYIYNILFDKLNLVKDIVIDEKFVGLTEKDFNPDVLYDPELITYIELMVKRMNNDSYDKMFRECVGYLNMIVRNYMPDKKKLRFKPVEIFREITNLIDLKMKSIEEYKNVIKHNKILINNMQLNYNKLNEKYQNLSKQYESYKIMVDKNIEKGRKDYFKYKEDKSEKIPKKKFILNFNKNNININFDNLETNSKLKRKRGFIFNDNILAFKNEPNSTGNRKKNIKRNFSTNKKRVLSSYKGNSIYNRYYNSLKNKSEKNIINLNGFNSFDNQMLKLRERREKKIVTEENKLIKENGNQEDINNFNRINNLIDETNRLFLYQPRMTSFQKKYNTIDNNENNTNNEIPDIKNNEDKGLYDNTLVKTFEGKIMKKLNNLIKSSKMK